MPKLQALFTLPLLAPFAVAQTPCDQLKLSLPDTTVTSIQFVPAGPFVAPAATIAATPAPAPAIVPQVAPQAPGRGGRGGAAPAGGRGAAAAQPPVPAYCRVMMVLKP